MGIPSSKQDEADDDDRSETLRETALEAAKETGIGAAVRTDDGTISSGSLLSIGSSQEVHPLELAVWKGYDEARTTVVEAAVAVEDVDSHPCGRCLQVLSDFSKDTELSLWITDGDSAKEYSLSDLLPK
jgi:cytidine deaminase